MRRFKQVDVFTKLPFRGNPVAVVLESDGLATADMQRIAAWTNLSETTFVLPPTSPAADYRLRIFTPKAELPFAGHPTIGSAHAVIEAGIVSPKGGKFRQECGAGVLDLEVEGRTIWLDAPPATDASVDAADVGLLEEILKAKSKGVPRIVNVGPRWLIVDLGDDGKVAALAPDMAALAELSNRLSIGGVTVYGASTDGRSAIHVRSFAPAHGIPEDPVCGSGNISVAAYIAMSGRMQGIGTHYVARQGMQMGRDGEVFIRYSGKQILLGGNAVTCVDGSLQA